MTHRMLLLPLLLLLLAPPAGADPAQEVIPPGARVRMDLEPLTRDRMFRDANVGIHVVDMESEAEVFSWRPDASLLPASTMKVLTAAAALKHLGPSYRFTTELLSRGTVSADGVLQGDLYVRGSGDPTLVLEKLWKMIYDLSLEGIQEISGNVYFDDTAFDRAHQIPGWNKQEDLRRGPAYFAPLGALSINFNTVAVVVGPGSQVGDPARVVLETESDGVVNIENRLVTGVPGSRRWVDLEREVEGRSVTFVLEGRVPANSDTLRYYRSIPDPTANFVGAFRSMLEDHEIRVRGHYLEQTAPEEGLRTLVQLRSPPLSNILMEMNKYSSNFMAEQVLKALGAQVTGQPGSTEGGLSAISDYLVSLGIPADEFHLVNGSGLSREIVLRPNHLTAVLVDMAQDPRVGHEFISSLAIGGQDGTLWARFRDENQVGRLRGKTGTINGVHCLAGYIEAPSGEIYAFAYLVNDLPRSIAMARRAHDRFIGTFLAASLPDPGE